MLRVVALETDALAPSSWRIFPWLGVAAHLSLSARSHFQPGFLIADGELPPQGHVAKLNDMEMY